MSSSGTNLLEWEWDYPDHEVQMSRLKTGLHQPVEGTTGETSRKLSASMMDVSFNFSGEHPDMHDSDDVKFEATVVFGEILDFSPDLAPDLDGDPAGTFMTGPTVAALATELVRSFVESDHVSSVSILANNAVTWFGDFVRDTDRSKLTASELYSHAETVVSSNEKLKEHPGEWAWKRTTRTAGRGRPDWRSNSYIYTVEHPNSTSPCQRLKIKWENFSVNTTFPEVAEDEDGPLQVERVSDVSDPTDPPHISKPISDITTS
ncbi:hypothetical protein BCR39DRAFT_517878 [Naematelia encephala]|uniref:Uncharacterized protein n=1 Tax=Naematelia encephala TaxID=71784 RepID=A0A1Y2BJP7_9TREE|nr:hypothetical protein BCR39DRAFT_517878 [Naematelia encephala]